MNENPHPKKTGSLPLALASALLPLVVFWAIETYWGLEAALIAGCITAVGEIAYEKIRLGKVSAMTASSNALVLGLGAISYFMKSPVAFRLQPAVMEWGMLVMMMVGEKMSGQPFLLQMMSENPLLEADKRALIFAQPEVLKRLKATNQRLAWFLALHGLAVAAVAIWGSTGQWIFLKGILFYVLLVLVMLPMYKRPRA